MSYATALVDWLACASAGASGAPIAAMREASEGLLEEILVIGAAGHVLDYDDTYLPGLAHLSAAVAPAALGVGAHVGASMERTLGAYAAGFEAMAALSAASHPSLYDRGWHPTAVCGVVGAAIAGGDLLELDRDQVATAVNLALLGASGLRSAFGSHGKSLQVGMAAATGVRAARLVASGASVPSTVRSGPASFEEVYGGVLAEPDPARPAIIDNWIKAYPCCLQTHSTIEAMVEIRTRGTGPTGSGEIRVHPVSRQAAGFDDVGTGLEAKFSIPYCTALALSRGPRRTAWRPRPSSPRSTRRRGSRGAGSGT
jgi:2-methylcitrate dehydratase PrpD